MRLTAFFIGEMQIEPNWDTIINRISADDSNARI